MWTVGLDRLAFGFHNPNHAAALACALLPLCWGWRRCLWLGRLLSLALFLALLMTQSRTGLVVALSGAAMWWRLRKGRFRVSHLGSHKLAAAGIAALAVAALWWMWPRMALDGSMLNRPKIWLAGLRLFAANPDGVGTGHNVVGTGPGGVSTNIHELTRIQIRFVRFVSIRGQSIGAARGHETALCAVHESPRARGTKALGMVVETRKRFAPRASSQLAVAKDTWPRILRISVDFGRSRRRKRIPH